jgi:Na+-translocating ferredoxin:NAD+ oxidoreductase RnfE subunit
MGHNKTLFLSFSRYFLQYTWFIRYVLVMVLVLVIVGALIISRVEGMSLDNSIYFAFITGLTIGYGDIAPVTIIGRVTSVFIGLIGIVFTGLVVAVSTKALHSAVEEKKKLK